MMVSADEIKMAQIEQKELITERSEEEHRVRGGAQLG
jgi:hypothetical protein